MKLPPATAWRWSKDGGLGDRRIPGCRKNVRELSVIFMRPGGRNARGASLRQKLSVVTRFQRTAGRQKVASLRQSIKKKIGVGVGHMPVLFFFLLIEDRPKTQSFSALTKRAKKAISAAQLLCGLKKIIFKRSC